MQTKNKEVKCVIWDLDDTIWNGILLESKKVKLKPGIKKIIGELDNRGILHSLASKNNYDNAMGKLREFGIAEYFLYPEINWNAKSVSVERIQKYLNLNMDSFLFIDDQPFERDEVQMAHPVVECLNADEYHNLLEHQRLNPRFITEDSKKRRIMYLEDIERKKNEAEYEGTPENFLESLQMEFIISKATEEDLKRAEELTIRTHQLNATGVQYSYEELESFRKSKKHKLYICELVDKYGSYGKIGLALINILDDNWHLKLLLMSCRVMSRSVGTILMTYIMKETKKSGKKLLADFKKTEVNRQMFITYKFANFKIKNSDDKGNILFENDLSFIQEFPRYTNVKIV